MTNKSKASGKSGIEAKIIETARRMFVENGFEETSMSDIAAKVGINRPTLHYYFRTKDKMFQAVFEQILVSLVPKVAEIIGNDEICLEKRIGKIIDAYYELFLQNPCMPLFVMREANRDIEHLLLTIKSLGIEMFYLNVCDALKAEMKKGTINDTPLRFIFLTFYGLLTMPFIAKGMCSSFLLHDDEDFNEMLQKWKYVVVAQMTALLSNRIPQQ